MSSLNCSWHYLLRLTFVALCLTGGAARAALIITFGTAVVPPQQTGSLEVFISSDNPLGDAIKEGSVFFEITTFDGVGDLQFLPSFNSAVSPQQSNSEQAETNYIYAQNTAANVGNFSSERLESNLQRLVQSDATADFNNVVVPFGSPQLLARLELFQQTPGATGTYHIFAREDPNATLFFNQAGDVAINPISYTNFGTVSSATAVPEPSSLLLCGAGLAFGLGRLRARRRLGQPAGNAIASPE